MAENNRYALKMRQLPKPEYRLMKVLIERYALKDESELFSIALSLLSEVERYNNGQGRKWILQVIDTFRSSPDHERSYDT